MKSTKPLFALAFAASLASASFAASETSPPLVRVPKTEAAMQATQATIAKDAASNSVKSPTRKAAKPAAHKTTKSATHQPKAKPGTAKQGKAAPAKKRQAKTPAAKK